MDTVYFISCVGQKRSAPSAAKDLYTSDWFKKARRYVENKGDSWFILSAEHGLVEPDRILSPYEKTLNEMPVRERRQWARDVTAQLACKAPTMKCAVFLAGSKYREFLAEHLRQRGVSVRVPMEGLRIGQQLKWLIDNE